MLRMLIKEQLQVEAVIGYEQQAYFQATLKQAFESQKQVASSHSFPKDYSATKKNNLTVASIDF